jgi:hypothetical protein
MSCFTIVRFSVRVQVHIYWYTGQLGAFGVDWGARRVFRDTYVDFPSQSNEDFAAS